MALPMTTDERMITFLNNEIGLHLHMLSTEKGRKILEREEKITDACFRLLKERYNLEPFIDILEMVGEKL